MADPVVFKTDDHGARNRDKLNDLAQRAQTVIDATGDVLGAKDDVLVLKSQIETLGQSINDDAAQIILDMQAVQTSVNDTAQQVADDKADVSQLKSDAESARDDAQLYASQAVAQTKIYDTEELGRAAVGDGQAFKVTGSGDVVVREYLRIDANTSTLQAEYPSVDRLRDVSEEMEFTRNALMVALYGDGPYPVFHDFFIGPYK